ncbi:MAG: GNAT family N-acetyltransferase [Deltaproteobacteria bacterium]|nr:GNAT family N-acetyltransferase [Deltaproteobacteria bacterium]
MLEIKLSETSYEKSASKIISLRNSNRAVPRDANYFNWRYSQRPCDGKPIIIMAEISGEAVGCLSLIPHHYYINGERRQVGILGDISVSKEFRGKGIAKKMFACLMDIKDLDKRVDACIVLPNEDAARPLESAGWVSVSRLERHVKILNLEKYIEKKIPNRLALKLLASALQTALKFQYPALWLRNRDIKGAPAAGFDARFDSLWSRFDKKGASIGQRDRGYLTWRYLSHPLTDYRLYTLTDGDKLCGYLIYHIEDDRCFVDDILCLHVNKYPEYLLARFIGHITKDAGCSSVILAVSRVCAKRLPLRKFGFFRRPDFQKFLVAGGRALKAPAFIFDDRWYLTQGDKDA